MSRKKFIYFPAQQWLRITLHRHIDLLSINFAITVRTLALCLPLDQWFWNLYCTNNNMIGECIVLSNIISAVSDKILQHVFRSPSWYYKNSQFFFILYQHATAYSSAIKFTRLMIHENIFVQAEGILKPMKTLVLIQHHVERILPKK